jgi:hypothetical protein
MTTYGKQWLLLGVLLLVGLIALYRSVIRPPCAAGQPIVASADDALRIGKPRIYGSQQFQQLAGFANHKEYTDALSLGTSTGSDLGEEYWIVGATLKRLDHEYFYSMRVWRCGEVTDENATPIK